MFKWLFKKKGCAMTSKAVSRSCEDIDEANEVRAKEGSNIKGFATVVFGDSFKITNIAILENKDKGELFVSMPRYRSNERDESNGVIYKDVCNPITAEFREELYTNILGKGLREAGQTAANAFRTFADKPEVDYSQKEQKHPITKAVLTPMKAMRKMFVSIELHLDASIDKLDNLAMNVQLDKEKHMENAKAQEQTEPERAEAERVEAEIVYSPMVAEPQEYQYNADAFEARGADEVKQEASHKEVSKVREDKAR